MENVTTEILENDFTTLQVMDWPMVQEYLQRCKYEESNHNIINMIMWLQTYPLFYYKKRRVLIVVGLYMKDVSSCTCHYVKTIYR